MQIQYIHPILANTVILQPRAAVLSQDHSSQFAVEAFFHKAEFEHIFGGNWHRFFALANQFLDNIPTKLRQDLAYLYNDTKASLQLLSDPRHDPAQAALEVADRLNSIAGAHQLGAQLRAFVIQQRPLLPEVRCAEISDATGRLPEMQLQYTIIATSLLTKLMIPIWGEFAHLMAQHHPTRADFGVGCYRMIEMTLQQDMALQPLHQWVGARMRACLLGRTSLTEDERTRYLPQVYAAFYAGHLLRFDPMPEVTLMGEVTARCPLSYAQSKVDKAVELIYGVESPALSK